MCRDLIDKKILVVDDNIINQVYAKTILFNSGAIITTAYDCDEAIKYLKNETFDIILMDIYMPYVSGIECSRIIREELQIKTPIIAVTCGLMDLHHELIPLINSYIGKPYSRGKLIDTVKSLIK